MGKASKKKVCEISNFKNRDLEPPSIPKTGLLQKSIFHIILIIVIGLLAYSTTFKVPFHFDDTPNIVENYKLRDLNNFWPPSDSRWFGFLTFALNYHLGGLNTFGYHIVNLTIHILNAIFVYYLVVLTFRTPYLLKITQTSQKSPSTPNNPPSPPFSKGGMGGFALFSALLFVSHPIQTQAVTYIVQRFTSLATFFYLLSLVMYIKFRSQQSAISGQQKLHAKRYTLYAISLISAILAMKTKEISFTLPFIIILYEFCFFKSQNYELRTMKLRRLLYLIPFLLTLLIIPLSLIDIDKPIGDAIGELREATQETEEIPRWSYLFTQFRVIVTYIRLLFLPINQNLDYDYPVYHSFFDAEAFLSFLFLLSIFSFGVYLFYRSRISLPEPKAKGLRDSSATPQNDTDNSLSSDSRLLTLDFRLIPFGILWFLITLSIESSIIPIRDVIFEHRLYLPSVGVFIAITTSVFILASKLKRKWPQIEKTVTPVLALIIIILSSATYARNIVWQDEVSLWEDVVRKSPEKARGHNNLGIIYRERGWADNAIEHYQIALKLNPNNASTHNNLGNAYYAKEWLDKSIQEYKTAIKLNPEHTEAHNNLGIAYHKQGHLDEAIQEYKMVLKLKPDCAVAHYNLGNAYKAKEWLDKSIQEYKTAIKLNPDYAEAHNNIGTAYEKKELLDEAIKEYEMALRLNPNDVIARNNLNRILHIKSK